MALVDRLFRKGSGRRVEVHLILLQRHFLLGAGRYAGQTIEPELVRARLADGCRSAELEPMPPEEFDRRSADLDAEAWRRLALAVSSLDLEAVRAALATLSSGRGVTELLERGFLAPARELPLLTLELLRQSRVRVEEFARQFVARLGAAVRGETDVQSRQQLEQLDYARLLAQVEQAKLSAEERLAYLQRLQDEQEAQRPRRGKW